MNKEMRAMEKKKRLGRWWSYQKGRKLWGASESSPLKTKLIAHWRDTKKDWLLRATHKHGIDYQETFTPVAKMNTIRIQISLVTNFDWPL